VGSIFSNVNLLLGLNLTLCLLLCIYVSTLPHFNFRSHGLVSTHTHTHTHTHTLSNNKWWPAWGDTLCSLRLLPPGSLVDVVLERAMVCVSCVFISSSIIYSGSSTLNRSSGGIISSCICGMLCSHLRWMCDFFCVLVICNLVTTNVARTFGLENERKWVQGDIIRSLVVSDTFFMNAWENNTFSHLTGDRHWS